MKTKLAALASYALIALLVFGARAVFSADFPALPDGGSLVQQTDGGAFITVDTGQTSDWVMTIRCQTGLVCSAPSPRCYYRLSTDGGTATTANQLLDQDRTFDLPVLQAGSQKYRYLSLLGEDGGQPCCSVQTQNPP